MTLKQWNELKLWLAPVTALILWAISVVCFVFGLSFKNPILVAGHDFTLIISFAIATCNTFIQLIGNSNLDKDESGVFTWVWFGSYVLGIASNTNSLLQMLGVSSVILEWAVALSLGAIIEIAPEKLIMIWVKSIRERPSVTHRQGDSKTFVPQKPHYAPNYQPMHKNNFSNNSSKQNHKGTDRRRELEASRRQDTPEFVMPDWMRNEH